MSITRIAISADSCPKSAEIHLMPCKINYDGVANVKSFFTNTIIRTSDTTQTDQTVLENGFRGRPLHGLHLGLPAPASTIGLVVNEKNQLESSFDKVYSWQLDEPKLTKQTDPFAKAMYDWFTISNVIHSG